MRLYHLIESPDDSFGTTVDHLSLPQQLMHWKAVVSWTDKKMDDLTDTDQRLAGTPESEVFLPVYQAKMKRMRALKAEAEKQYKALRKQLVDQHGKQSVGPQIPEAQVPQKIVVGNQSFGNPYFVANFKSDRYAGDINGYPFSSVSLERFIEIQNVLTRNGLQPLTTMYAGVVIGRGGTRLQNWAAIGANGKFVWRKYEPSVGAGQNWIYVAGRKQQQTSAFFSHPDHVIDNVLAQLK